MIKKSTIVFMLLLTTTLGVLDAATRRRNKSNPDAPKLREEAVQFVILVPSYKNAQWYRRNLASIFMQKYEHYRVVYIDDCSPDGTADLVEKYVQDMGQEDRFTLVRNKVRVKAMANIYTGVHICHDNEVVVMLDGDDWFHNSYVLDVLANVYVNPDVWITYGSFCMFPSGSGWAQETPKEVVKKNAFRYHQPAPSHLRTFYAKLFKMIDKSDLCENGDFYEYTYDLAMMFPMMEMAGERFKFIPNLLYVYNAENSINDHKVGKYNQRQTDLRIRSKERYQRIDSLFDYDL